MPFLYHYQDHVDSALARRLEQDKPAAVLEALIRSFVARQQTIEDALWQLVEQRDVESAEGVQLDTLGAIVGEARRQRTDDVYRLWIKAHMRAQRASGTPTDALEIARLVIEPDATVSYVDLDPRDAEYQVSIGNSSIDLVELAQILRLAKPAGVQLDVISEAGPDAFAFDGGPDGLGWNDGDWAGLV